MQGFTKTFPELFQLSMWIEEHKVKPNGSDDVLFIVDGHIGCRLRVPRVEQKIEVKRDLSSTVEVTDAI